MTLVFATHKSRLPNIDFGKTGVWIFFVLSGFLIIGELHKTAANIEEITGERKSAIKEFFIKRFARIFPIYYLTLLLLVCSALIFNFPGKPYGFPWHFSYLSNVWMACIIEDWAGPFTHLWSLSVEQQFYLIIPFLMLFSKSSGHSLILISAAVAGALLHCCVVLTNSSPVVALTLSPINWSLLVLGGLISINQHRLPQFDLCHFFIVLIVLITCFFLTDELLDLKWQIVIRDLIQILSIAVLIIFIVRNQTSRVVSILEIKPLAFIGTISYGVYLLHNFIPNPLGPALKRLFNVEVVPLLQFTVGALLNYICVVCVCAALWFTFERPIITWVRRRFVRN